MGALAREPFDPSTASEAIPRIRRAAHRGGLDLDGHGHVHGDRGASAQHHLRAPGVRGARGTPGLSTAFFSLATGALAVAGLVREIVAASYFGITRADVGVHDRLPGPEPGAQPVRRRRDPGGLRPRLHRAARAGRTREAFRLASTLIFLVALVLGAITALFVLAGAGADAALRARVRGRAARPHGHPLAAPVPDPGPARASRGWSSASSTATTASGPSRSRRSSGTWRSSPSWWRWRRRFSEEDQIYAYAIGVLVGTVIQLAIPAWDLRNTPFGVRGRCPHRSGASPAQRRPGRAAGCCC